MEMSEYIENQMLPVILLGEQGGDPPNFMRFGLRGPVGSLMPCSVRTNINKLINIKKNIIIIILIIIVIIISIIIIIISHCNCHCYYCYYYYYYYYLDFNFFLVL